jgi:dTDP-4-dehydrorhamnose reductase
VVRVASLFGPAGASGKGGNFVETVIRAARERGVLRVVDDQLMSPTSAADAADAILDLVQVRAAAGVYHVVNEGWASWFEFASEIVALSRVEAELHPISTEAYPTPARRPPYSVLATRKLNEALGRSLPDWRDGLRRYLVAKGHIG